jgi:hypothetical protein
MRLTLSFALLAAFFAAGMESRGAVIYSSAGSSYTQNFDTLPITPNDATQGNSPIGWTDDNASPGSGNFSIVGWYLWHPLGPLAEGGFNGNQRMRFGSGAANTGAFMSYGPSATAERALGSLSSGTLANAPPATTNTTQFMGLRLTNTTGVTLTQFTLSYDGEQWRDGGAPSPATPTAQSLTFGYSWTATTVQDTPNFITGVPALDFTSPVFVNTSSGAAVNGNTVGKVAKGPFTVGGLNWTPGSDLWIRWGDINDASNDHGLAIDNLSFSADVPEPSSLMLLVAAVVGLAVAKRR